MKLKFLDGLMAAVKTKDEAQITAALVNVMDAARDEEEAKRKEEEEAKDKARDARTAKLVADSIAAAFKARDEAEAEEKKKAEAKDKKGKDDEEEEAKKKKEEDEELEEELEEESGNKDARKAKDSALLSESFESVKMLAEIIAPGVQIPTFDAALDPKKTFRDCHCALRRKALTVATQDADTAEIVTSIRGRALDSAEVASLPCSQVRTIFNGVAAMKKAANNAAATRDGARAASTAAATVDSPMEAFKKASAARWNHK